MKYIESSSRTRQWKLYTIKVQKAPTHHHIAWKTKQQQQHTAKIIANDYKIKIDTKVGVFMSLHDVVLKKIYIIDYPESARPLPLRHTTTP